MSYLSEDAQQKVIKLLINQGVLNTEKLEEYTKQAADTNLSLFAYLAQNDVVSEETLTKAIAEVSNVPYVNLQSVDVNPDVLKLLPKETAERFMAVPLGEMQQRLVVAMLDANNVQAVDFLANKIGRPLKVYLASESGIKSVLEQYQASLDAGISKKIAKESDSGSEQEAGHKSDSSGGKEVKSIETIVQDSPISRALTEILEYAVKTRASDIHIEPLENSLRIRSRIDGVMQEIMTLPKSIEPALVSRVKILSNLKIDEHRTPQDGQFTIKVADKEVDLRIAIAPVVWGEQVVIRLLDKSGTSFDLEEMGYRGNALEKIKAGIRKPNGMVLTSGPTGSGKSTSLYALMQMIKSEEVNIITLEDPVEYKIEGVNQIQINPDVGLTFASGLRSVLRQDPNIIMVGEIRDSETANLAVQAALTGHLVFSTLHTNSAAGVLPRLLDMEVEPFLIASTVNTVIGQRLVRRVPQDAEEREEYQSNEAETQSIHETLGDILPKTKEEIPKVAQELGYKNLPLAGDNAYTLCRGKPTKRNPSGYKGRLGLYEVFDVNEEIEKLIVNRATSGDIQRKAREQGMITMREDGYLKALDGLTTLDEVNRVAAVDSA